MPGRRPLNEPAIKRGKTWVIVYYIEVQGKRKRVRVSARNGVELNAIFHLEERERAAVAMAAEIRSMIAPPALVPAETYFSDALRTAVELKRSSKEATNKAFGEVTRWLIDFFQKQGWQYLKCSQVKPEHIQAYFDHIIVVGKVRNSTHNTRKNNLRALFSEIVKRGYLPENFVSRVKDRPKVDPIRRSLTDVEKKALYRYAFENDLPLALAMMLLGFLAIRPGEMRDLRVSSVDLERGVIRFPADFSKNNRNSVVTIPEEVIPVLRSFNLDKYPGSYYLFGKAKGRHNSHLLPRPERCGKNTLSGRFRVAVRALARQGVIQDTRGVQLYSLKDTLAIFLLDQGVDPETAMRHFRQSDLNTFQRYVKRLGVISEKIRAVKVDVPLPNFPEEDNSR